MTIPANFKDWAEARQISAFHPDSWAPDDLAAFMAWKRAHVTARQQARIDDGTWTLMSDDTRATWLRDDERMATAPPPSMPWTRCACHVFSPVRVEPDTSPHGLDYIESFRPKVPA